VNIQEWIDNHPLDKPIGYFIGQQYLDHKRDEERDLKIKQIRTEYPDCTKLSYVTLATFTDPDYRTFFYYLLPVFADGYIIEDDKCFYSKINGHYHFIAQPSFYLNLEQALSQVRALVEEVKEHGNDICGLYIEV
jgi:hypothetical protein